MVVKKSIFYKFFSLVVGTKSLLMWPRCRRTVTLRDPRVARKDSLKMSLGIEVLASAQTAASIDSVLKREDGKFMLNGNDQIVAVQELLGAKRPMGRTIFAQSFVSGAN